MATNDEVASHLGISPTRVSQLKSAGILPDARRRANNLTACRTAYLKHLREVAAGRQSRDGGGLDLVEERARLTRAQAEMTERKNAEAEGRLLSVASFHTMVTASFARVRAKLLALPSKMAPLVAATTTAKAHQILRDDIHRALDELATPPVGNWDMRNCIWTDDPEAKQ